jgi:hypothetical protein
LKNSKKKTYFANLEKEFAKKKTLLQTCNHAGALGLRYMNTLINLLILCTLIDAWCIRVFIRCETFEGYGHVDVFIMLV